ncbi:MAG: hypothetical protein E6604_02115, partial [Veillonella sp.]|nr:hypothetical protein [Veillonella sp.]
MKITDDLKTATASQSNLAKALGLSRQRVSQLLFGIAAAGHAQHVNFLIGENGGDIAQQAAAI